MSLGYQAEIEGLTTRPSASADSTLWPSVSTNYDSHLSTYAVVLERTPSHIVRSSLRAKDKKARANVERDIGEWTIDDATIEKEVGKDQVPL